MKRFIFVCLALLVADTAMAAPSPVLVMPGTGSGGTVAAQLHVADDILLSFGNTLAAPDCWFEWDTAGTDDFELKCTDIDGAATDGIIFSVDTGTDDVVFVGDLTLAALTVGGTSTFNAVTTHNTSTYAEGDQAVLIDFTLSNAVILDIDNADAGDVTVTVTDPTAVATKMASLLIRIVQGNDGGFDNNVIWPANFKWPADTPPVITTTSQAVDKVGCDYWVVTDTYECTAVQDQR